MSIQDLTNKIDEVAASVVDLQTKIALLQASAADCGTEAEREALAAKIDALKSAIDTAL